MRAKSRSLLVAVLVTSTIALLDAWTGGHAILLGLLIAGSRLAAASLDTQATAMVGLYALGLAVLLGIPDGIFATTDHDEPAGAELQVAIDNLKAGAAPCAYDAGVVRGSRTRGRTTR